MRRKAYTLFELLIAIVMGALVGLSLWVSLHFIIKYW
jgi:type II secretory pathway component PulJ